MGEEIIVDFVMFLEMLSEFPLELRSAVASFARLSVLGLDFFHLLIELKAESNLHFKLVLVFYFFFFGIGLVF